MSLITNYPGTADVRNLTAFDNGQSGVRQVAEVLIAKQDRTYADALSWSCAQVFPQAQIRTLCRGMDVLVGLQNQPVDFLLLGLAFPDLDGMHLFRQVMQRHCARHVIVIAEVRDERLLPMLLGAGVDAILDTRSEPLSAVGEVLQIVKDGKAYVSPTLHGYLLNRSFGQNSHPDLTPGELRVLGVIGTGENNGEAAAVLGLRETTVQTHRRNIMRKLRVTTSAKMVQEAIRLGLARICSAENHLEIKPEPSAATAGRFEESFPFDRHIKATANMEYA